MACFSGVWTSFVKRWMDAGEGSLTPPDSPWFDVKIDWAPFPRDAQGVFTYSHKTALALINSQALIVKAEVRKEPYKPPSGFKTIDLLYAHMNGMKLPTVPDKVEDKVLQGTTIENKDAVIIFIRGTVLKADVIADLKAFPVQLDGFEGKIHRGFRGCYTRGINLRSQIKLSLAKVLAKSPKDKPIIFSGHSLGAALATMAFYDALSLYPNEGGRMLLVTYGSPKVGNKAFVRKFEELVSQCGTQHWRINNKNDIVTMMGPSPPYRHCGEDRSFDLKLASNWKAWTKNHIDAYMAYFEQHIQKK